MALRRAPLLTYKCVSDNLKRDFIAPNALGRETVCLLDDGRNIHKQDFDAGTDEMRARKGLRELV